MRHLWPVLTQHLSFQMGMHEALSKFNGFFFACYESTQIVGNVLASLVLMQGTYNTSDHGVPSCGAGKSIYISLDSRGRSREAEIRLP